MIIDIKINANFINADEVILKMAELIKEGYTLTSIEDTRIDITMCKDYIAKRAFEITLHNKLADEDRRYHF